MLSYVPGGFPCYSSIRCRTPIRRPGRRRERGASRSRATNPIRRPGRRRERGTSQFDRTAPSVTVQASSKTVPFTLHDCSRFAPRLPKLHCKIVQASLQDCPHHTARLYKLLQDCPRFTQDCLSFSLQDCHASASDFKRFSSLKFGPRLTKTIVLYKTSRNN